ncbi:hypothetical protein C440_02573 [Haloferax mucosum ATCC BAA-1512]|uniref:DUF7343 domain-containing protein n=1 Tax=Haloferax mucosum ATCC BAA-1512 TaxID=662479 RepID=M0IMR9_9EURY|nr:hypothetical protein C440_02573 [Haloferax mucosum ATCC BAA-1512]
MFVVVAAIASAPAAGSRNVTDFEIPVEGQFTDTVPVKQTGASTFLWESESNTLAVEFTAANESERYEVCIRNETGERLACQYERSASRNRVVRFEYDNLSSFSESNNVTVVLRTDTLRNPKTIGSDTIDITVIRQAADIDGDGLTNTNEVTNNSSMFLIDTDRDGLSDGAEVTIYGTSPTNTDTDSDNLTDATELSKSLDPTDPDTDGDGLNDELETRLGTEPDDENTTPMLLFAGGTFCGFLAVSSRWVICSSQRRLTGFLSSVRSSAEALRSDTADDPGPTNSPRTSISRTRSRDRHVPKQSAPQISPAEAEVLQLLRENEGWVYQSRVVERTNWSKSKVSRLLSKMNDKGMVEKVSVGRQNIIAEAGSMPEAAKSTFDE